MAELPFAAARPPGRFVVAIFVAALLVSIVAALTEWAITRLSFLIEGGGLVSCSIGQFGVVLDCHSARWLYWYLPGGLIAAAIATCVLRSERSIRVGEPARATTISRLLLAVIGPGCALNLAIVTPFVVFYPSLFSPISMWGVAQLFFTWESITPVVVAAVLGTVAFWFVFTRRLEAGSNASASFDDVSGSVR